MKKKLIELVKNYWQKFWELFDDPVVIGLAFALVSLPIYFIFDLPTLTTADQQNISDSIQWFGVPYGFIIAYVLANVWSQFEAAKRIFDQEADTLLMLYNTFLLSSKKKVIEDVDEKVKEYAKVVINYYFPAAIILQDDKEARKNEQEEKELSLLKEMRRNVKVLLDSRKDHDLAIELLRLLNKLSDARGDRAYLIAQRVPSSVGYLAIVASATWIVPFYALQFSNQWVGALYIVAVTIVVVSTYLIILDLDEPIGGLWGVDVGSWTDVFKVVEKEIESR